jgi:benzylsuccinate CoA-transferase BbsF subunit
VRVASAHRGKTKGLRPQIERLHGANARPLAAAGQVPLDARLVSCATMRPMEEWRRGALSGLRICDLTGQLAGAGATRTLAAFGAEVIRVEDPVRQGRWDMLRGLPPFPDGEAGLEKSGAFNNHNVGKLGVTINTRTDEGKNLLARLIAASDVVTENFSAEVLESWGFGYERMRELRPDIIYVSNCGFGHSGPYRPFRTWGPIVQAVCGLTASVGLPGQPSAGFGYSYMDHHGANLMAFAVLAALHHRHRTGEGQWIDMSTVEGGAALLGPDVLDWSVNGVDFHRDDWPDSNRHGAMVPHGIFPASGDDEWVALACRTDEEWGVLAGVIDEPWCRHDRWATTTGRRTHEDELDEFIGRWTASQDKFVVQERLLAVGVAAAAVQTPPERIDHDAAATAWGLWPESAHPAMGTVRVDGLPVHLSRDDWRIDVGAPMLGQHNRQVFGEILGLDDDAIASLEAGGHV